MGEKKKILIVDDSISTCVFIKSALESPKYQVKTLMDSNTAIEEIFKELPDIIVLDIFMPGINGIELCKMLKKDEKTRKIPVIMYTVSEEHIYRIESETAGADRYVTKSSDISELVENINELLN